MKSFAAEVASSPTADITIYRALVDGDSRALGCLDADTSAGSVEKREWAILDSEVMLTLVPRRERASVLMSAPPLAGSSTLKGQHSKV
jgi:hypothetical protein